MSSETLLTAPGSELSWNIVRDITQMFDYEFMRNAFLAGTIVAVVAGLVGYFVVLRALAFAGHALSHVGFAGASGAVAAGVNPIAGLLLFTMGGGAVMGALGARIRGRDVVIGIVLAFMLGLGVLFLSLYRGYATQAYAILFGDIVGISTADVLVTLAAGVVTLAALAAIYRPLLFASLDDEVAAARGVPVRALSIGFMLLLALAVSEAVQVVGVLLVFALLVTPAAIAERFTVRPPVVMACAAGLGVLFTWLGLTIAYYAPPPVSFFITSIAFVTYIGARIAESVRNRGRRSAAAVAEAA